MDIRIEELPALHGLEIKRDARMWKIPSVLGDAFPRIDRYISENGAKRTGAPYVRYMEIDWEQMRHCGPLQMFWQMLTTSQPMRIGMGVEDPIAGDGEIEAISSGPQRCVRAIHKGPYQKVGDAYKVIVDWAESNGVKLANHTMEIYVNDPTTVAKEDIETLIMIPVESGPPDTAAS